MAGKKDPRSAMSFFGPVQSSDTRLVPEPQELIFSSFFFWLAFRSCLVLGEYYRSSAATICPIVRILLLCRWHSDFLTGYGDFSGWFKLHQTIVQSMNLLGVSVMESWWKLMKKSDCYSFWKVQGEFGTVRSMIASNYKTWKALFLLRERSGRVF